MKFYLSSYKLGNDPDKFKELVSFGNKKVAYIPNALDFSNDLERRKQSELIDINDLKSIGLNPERIDLKDYFKEHLGLEKKLAEKDAIWVRGGNVFVLRQAMNLSGFDKTLRKLINKEIVYGGFSAGVCVLVPSLEGLDLMDDPKQKPYGEIDVIWSGLGIIDFAIVPHFESDHRESDNASRLVEYYKQKNIPYKSLSDGEVIIL